ncbi:MAG: ankyrin repeat domain-containing protein [Planctomycetes bacterium]|nr:ankyrin repeat domain-containing protein [Planctomycetota bacterium]
MVRSTASKFPVLFLSLVALLAAPSLAMQATPPTQPANTAPAGKPAGAPTSKEVNFKEANKNKNSAKELSASKPRTDIVNEDQPPTPLNPGATPPGATTTAPLDSTPVIKIEPEILDLGEMMVDTAKSGKVKLINISDKPVTITKAVTSCGCTTAGSPKDPIPVGGSAEVEITLKPGPKAGVPLSKRVTFQIDGHTPMMLTVQGTVPAFITMSPDQLEAPGEGQTSEGAITFKCLDGTPFKITSAVPPIVPDLSPEAKAEQVVHVDWKAWDETGRTIKLTFSTDHPKVPSLSLLIRRPPTAGTSVEPRAPGANPADRAASALVTAARAGDVEKVKKELEGKIDVNAPESAGGRSALHWAAKENRVEVIPVLLAAKADVNNRDRAGKTPLCVAAENRDPKGVESMKLLIAAKSDVNSKDRLGGTPLLWASGLGTPEAVALLIDSGAEINIPDKNGLTPLLWAAGTGDPRSVQLLIDHKADLTVADNLTGDTAVMRAARNGKFDSMLILIKAGSNLEVKNRQGMTTWLVASASGTVEKLKALKEAKADTQAKDSRGWNALDYAKNRADQNRSDVIKYLETELGMKPAAEQPSPVAPLPTTPPAAPGR